MKMNQKVRNKLKKGLPMPDCDKLKTSFSDYLDGEIPQEQRKELDTHFSDCPHCHEILRQMRIIQQSLKKLPHITTSPDFERRLHQQIFNPAAKNFLIFPLFHNWKLPAMGSAIVLAMVGLFLVLDSSSDQKKTDFQNVENPLNTAAPQFPGNRTSPTQATTSENSSTRIQPSSPADSTHVNTEGVQQVGNSK